MKYYFVINPLAGTGKERELLLKQIEDLKNEYDIETYFTKCERDATRFVSEVCNSTSDEICFFACGGDGTINEVCSGVYGHKNAIVSVFPCGSGNDFVKCFEKGSFLNVKNVLEGKEMLIDLMSVNDRYCVNVCNFGFDTVVAINVNEDRKKHGHGSKFSYTTGIIKALVKAMKNKAQVYANGELLNPNGEYLLCTIGNGQYVGGSFNCSPRALLDDSMLEVCLCKCLSRIKFVTMIGDYTNGNHLDNEKFKKFIEYRRVDNIKVVAPDGFDYTIDGEIVHDTEMNVKVLPKVIRLLVPGKPLYEEK